MAVTFGRQPRGVRESSTRLAIMLIPFPASRSGDLPAESSARAGAVEYSRCRPSSSGRVVAPRNDRGDAASSADRKAPAGRPPTGPAGWPVHRASSCRLRCSVGCSGACSLSASPRPFATGQLLLLRRARAAGRGRRLRRPLRPAAADRLGGLRPKRPFGRPGQVLAFLGRDTHCRRLLAAPAAEAGAGYGAEASAELSAAATTSGLAQAAHAAAACASSAPHCRAPLPAAPRAADDAQSRRQVLSH